MKWWVSTYELLTSSTCSPTFFNGVLKSGKRLQFTAFNKYRMIAKLNNCALIDRDTSKKIESNLSHTTNINEAFFE